MTKNIDIKINKYIKTHIEICIKISNKTHNQTHIYTQRVMKAHTHMNIQTSTQIDRNKQITIIKQVNKQHKHI